MPPPAFISIDQNSQPLWDVVPKLAVLSREGMQGTHCIEDIDTAFTRRGGALGDTQLELARERYYRGGASDWGASLFYPDFLGRSPHDLRELETYTGLSTKALARKLDCTVDDLYDRYGVSDNWQLIGTSYLNDKLHHRVIGDLSVEETAPFIEELLAHARDDLLGAFPESNAQDRINSWFSGETGRLRQLIETHRQGRLVDLYAAWMQPHTPQKVKIKLTSDLLRRENAELLPPPTLAVFLQEYRTVSKCYNEAVSKTGVGLSPLSRKRGELPFAVVWHKNGRMSRSSLFFEQDRLTTGEDSKGWRVGDNGALPLAQMADDGVLCISGKAIPLVIDVRMNPGGDPLARPDRG